MIKYHFLCTFALLIMQQMALELGECIGPSFNQFIHQQPELIAYLKQLPSCLNVQMSNLATPNHFKMVYLWGDKNCGKTHLLQALALHGLKKNIKIVYLNPKSASQDFIHKDDSYLYLVDDIHLLDTNIQQALFNLINELRIDLKSAIVLTANCASQELKTYCKDLNSRLQWGLSYHLPALSLEQIHEAIYQYGQEYHIELNKSLIQCLLNYHGLCIQSIKETIAALAYHSLEQQKKVSVSLLKHMLGDVKFN